MTQHTAEPWVIVPQSDGSAMIAREFETGKQMNPKGLRLIAHCLARGNTLPEDEANAHLIASAPELLEACKAAKKFLEPDLVEPGRTVFWKLVNAIAKAEGKA